MSASLSVLDSRVMRAAFHFDPHNLVRSVKLAAERKNSYEETSGDT